MHTTAIAAAILSRVAEGASLRTAASENGTTHSTFLRWCDADPALANQYARARVTGCDAEFEDLDRLQHETPPCNKLTGAVDTGWVAWRRLQIDTKKWELSKKSPKFGEKLELAGAVGLKREPSDYSDAELASIIAAGVAGRAASNATGSVSVPENPGLDPV